MRWHDRGYGVLVDELRVAVAAQKQAEIVEPGHYALQLHAVHQEYREWNFGLADMVQKRVLQVVTLVSHGVARSFYRISPIDCLFCSALSLPFAIEGRNLHSRFAS
jgi:hypothetical protein